MVSCTLSEHMTTQITIIKVWYLARNKKQIKDAFVFHSDRGAHNFFSFKSKIIQSMKRKDLRLRIKSAAFNEIVMLWLKVF